MPGPIASFYKSITSFYTRKAAWPPPVRTFVGLFHQPNKIMHIRILTALFLVQSCLACQRNQEEAAPLASATLGSPSNTACQKSPDATSLSAANAGSLTIADYLQRPVDAGSAAASIVFQSLDGGQTWQDVSAGLPADLEVWGVSSVGGEIFLGTRTGLYRSSTAYAAPIWQKENFLTEHITDVFPGRGGLYARSFDSGFFQEGIPGSGMWQPVHTTLKSKNVRTILDNPDGTILVGCDNGIFKSSDKGKTWKQVFVGDMVLNLVASDGVLMGGGYQGVLRSTDSGDHWEVVLDENLLAKKTGRIGDRFFTIFGTSDPTRVSPEGITNRLRTSADNGQTWQRIDSEQAPLPAQSKYDMDVRLSQVRDIYDIVQVGQYLFCSFDAGIFRSSDQGKTWELVFPTVDRGSFSITVSGQVIYAVQGGGGC